MTRELLQQALRAFERTERLTGYSDNSDVMQALRTALASPEQPASEDKPVAWIWEHPSFAPQVHLHGGEMGEWTTKPLYLRPAPADQDDEVARLCSVIDKLLEHFNVGEYDFAVSKIVCPYGGDLHFHHDGCGACAIAEESIERAGEKK